MRKGKLHLVTRDHDNPWQATSMCRQFTTTLPFPWDAWRSKESNGLCKNCERIRQSRGLGFFRMTAFPKTSDYHITMSFGGWKISSTGMMW